MEMLVSMGPWVALLQAWCESVMHCLFLANLSITLLALYMLRSTHCHVKSMQGTIDSVPDHDTSISVALGALGWSESTGISHCLRKEQTCSQAEQK